MPQVYYVNYLKYKSKSSIKIDTADLGLVRTVLVAHAIMSHNTILM